MDNLVTEVGILNVNCDIRIKVVHSLYSSAVTVRISHNFLQVTHKNLKGECVEQWGMYRYM